MSAVWGNQLKITLFGESHGKAVGVTVSGLPAGLLLDMEQIQKEMQRRAPGKSPLSTSRRETDQPEIISGLYQGRTTGTPLCAVIRNEDVRSEDYQQLQDLMRPGHGDYPGQVRYKGFADPRGGGHFSGRLTAPLVFAGAIAKQVLSGYGIVIAAHILRLHQVEDLSFAAVAGSKNDLKDVLDEEIIRTLQASELPLLDPGQRSAMTQAIMQAREAGDSVGGVIECAVLGMPAGVGEPFFTSVEAALSHLLFAIPGVKGVEFGEGFAMAGRLGSQCNDTYYFEGKNVKTLTNHCGGVLGGISTGMPVLFRCAVRPTASIGKTQKTISLSQGKAAELTLTGRHDPCIVPRAVVVVEAVAALAILDLLKENQACQI
jgi:chorismate synthase